MKSKIILSILIIIVICFIFFITNFSHILKDDIDNIEKITIRHPGNGKLYSTTNRQLINKFITAMNSAKYLKVVKLPIPLSGTSPITLYSENNTKIASVTHKLKFIEINNKNYMEIGRDKEKFEAFYKEFYSDEYIVNE